MSTNRSTPVLPDAVTSPNGKLVVLYVQSHESPTVEQLAADLGLSKLTLLTVLDRLVDRGILRMDEEGLRMTGDR